MTDKFTFKYENEDGKEITFVLKQGDFAGWPSVLQDFIYFLEATSFVGVRDKVRIQHSPFFEDDWYGDYFTTEEDKDIFAWEKEYEEENKDKWLQQHTNNENTSNS